MKLKYFIAFIFFISIFCISCGPNNEKNVNLSLKMKSPKLAEQYQDCKVILKVYNNENELLKVAETFFKTENCYVEIAIVPQTNIKIAVSLINSDSILMRGSKVLDVLESTSTIDLTLNEHPLPEIKLIPKLSCSADFIHSIKSNDFYTVVAWGSTWCCDNCLDGYGWAEIISVFDEVKGIFTNNYIISSSLNDSMSERIITKDFIFNDSGLITVVGKLEKTSKLFFYEISRSKVNKIFEKENLAESGSKINLFYNNNDIVLYLAKTNESCFYQLNDDFFKIKTLTSTEFPGITDFTKLRVTKDKNNRFHFIYNSNEYSFNLVWRYLNSLENSFEKLIILSTISEAGYSSLTSQPEFLYNDNIAVFNDNFMIANFQESLNDTRELFIYKITSDKSSNPDKFYVFKNNSDFKAVGSDNTAKIVINNDGYKIYYTMFSSTKNNYYFSETKDFGINWDAPQELYNGAIVKQNGMFFTANNNNFKACFFIKEIDNYNTIILIEKY